MFKALDPSLCLKEVTSEVGFGGSGALVLKGKSAVAEAKERGEENFNCLEIKEV